MKVTPKVLRDLAEELENSKEVVGKTIKTRSGYSL